MDAHEPFALLLPVYGGDRVEFVRDAFHSAVEEQTLPPDQVVLVRDGPVSEDLEVCLTQLRDACPVPITYVPLDECRGLGPALDAGLAASKYDVIARMDADDIALPNRFEVQIPLISAGADIVGAGLYEFGESIADVVGQRTPPTDPVDIVRYSRMHDPFNHPTVVYRREAVQAVGGYGDLRLMEDYLLFARMLANGARPVNVADPLVYYRVGAGAYQRRGGRDLLRSELTLQRTLYDDGFTTRVQYVRNVVIRGGYRLLPWWVRRAAYRAIVATYGRRRGRARAAVSAPSTALSTPATTAQPEPPIAPPAPAPRVLRGERER